MKKKVTVYFTPIILEIELDNDLDEYEVEEEINRQIYEIQADEILDDVDIDYWEEG